MEIEIDSNINSTHSSSSANDNVPIYKYLSNKKSLEMDSILKFLIEKYSLNEVMKSIIFSTSSSKKKVKRISELDSIINQILQKEGALKMLQTIFELKNVIKNKIKKISMVAAEVKENFIEIKDKKNKEKDINSKNKISDSNPDIRDIIEIPDENFKNSNRINSDKNNNKNNGVIIDINDNYIDIGGKKVENEEIIDLTDKKLNSSNYIELYSNNDQSNKKSIINKSKRILDPSKILYHCSFIGGIYYKYVAEYVKEKEVTFICINPKCKAWGIYDLEEKAFILNREHNNWKNNYCCKKYMNAQDERNKIYMIQNNEDEILIYNDKNDEI